MCDNVMKKSFYERAFLIDKKVGTKLAYRYVKGDTTYV